MQKGECKRVKEKSVNARGGVCKRWGVQEVRCAKMVKKWCEKMV